MTWLSRTTALCAAALLVLGSSAVARANIICSTAGTFCGSHTPSGESIVDTAAAQFSITSGTLTIVLTNTSTFASGAYHNPDVLSGLFFNIQGSPLLIGQSATASGMITPPSTTVSGSTDVSGRWGWKYSSSGYSSTNLTTSANYGIAAAGFSSLTPSFSQSNFGTGPSNNLGGLGYSIVGDNFTSIAGNAHPLAEDSVTFVFTGLSPDATINSISNVTFAYGTAPDGEAGGNGGTPVPEPASLILLATALLGFGLVWRRRTA